MTWKFPGFLQIVLTITFSLGISLTALGESDGSGSSSLALAQPVATTDSNGGEISNSPPRASYLDVAVLDTGVQLQSKMSPAMLTLGSYFALRDQPNHDRLAGLQMHWMGIVQGSF
jgi:hypothetical protein